jgi:hypothetical protein
MLLQAEPSVLGTPLSTATACPAPLFLHILAPRDLSGSKALAANLLASEFTLDLWQELFPNFNLSFLLPVDDIITLGCPSLMHQQHGYQVSGLLNPLEFLLNLGEGV